MQQIYIEAFLKGYARKTMRSIQDITQHPSKHIIEERVKILRFFDDYGAEATKRAFGVSRSTVFLWKQRLKAGHGRLAALAPGSRAPKQHRRRNVDDRITNFIVGNR